MEQQLLPLRDLDEEAQRERLIASWEELGGPQRFVWNKLLTGGFRVGVSQRLVTRALAESAGLEPAVIAHRLMGTWSPTADFFEQLRSPAAADFESSRPYPFFLAHQLDEEPSEKLGDRAEWLAEWKWDGIRAQLIRRGGETYIWSRGEELMTDRFPELRVDATRLPDGVVLDGEILAWKDGVLPFALLQRRIGRKTLGPKILKDAPVVFMAFDLLEHEGVDIREQPLGSRRELLKPVLDEQPDSSAIRSAAALDAEDWAALTRMRQASREHGVEGLMLKRLDATYGVGRARPLVEMEDRALHDRLRTALRPARPRPPRRALYRLHLRRLARRRADALRQSLFGADRPGDPTGRPLRPPEHARTLWAGASRQAGTRV